MSDLARILAKADALYFQENKLQSALSILEKLDKSSVEVLYRMARIYFYRSDRTPKYLAKVELANKGLQCAKDALKANPGRFESHLWYASTLFLVSMLRGLKERGACLHEVKKHLLRAKELETKGGRACHGYGLFLYGFAVLTWYESAMMECLNPNPPGGSYEEALENFLQAEQAGVEPDYSTLNKLMIARCHFALGNYAGAKSYLNQIASVRIINEDDAECIAEAKKLLDEIKSRI